MSKKRTPTKVKEASGTLRKCRVNVFEPDYVSIKELPDPPKYLSEVGRDEYYSTASELLALGILQKVGFKLFISYCVQVGIYFDAIEKIYEIGTVIANKNEEPKINPYVRVANDALALMIRVAVEFGITPASSSKVSVKDSKDDRMKLLQSLKQKL